MKSTAPKTKKNKNTMLDFSVKKSISDLLKKNLSPLIKDDKTKGSEGEYIFSDGPPLLSSKDYNARRSEYLAIRG
jgi:hypothetical protein